jgi:hypothetical protein
VFVHVAAHFLDLGHRDFGQLVQRLDIQPHFQALEYRFPLLFLDADLLAFLDADLLAFLPAWKWLNREAQ